MHVVMSVHVQDTGRKRSPGVVDIREPCVEIQLEVHTELELFLEQLLKIDIIPREASRFEKHFHNSYWALIF